jgi:hypothetical protein
VKTGSAADEVLIDLLPQPESNVRIDVATGAGDDRIDVRSHSELGPIDLSLAIHPGTSLGVVPESGDKVLVEFEHGDFNRPVIIGTLWNGNSPPQSGKEGSYRSTLRGQQVLFDLDVLGSAGADAVASMPLVSERRTVDTIKYIIDISAAWRVAMTRLPIPV